MEQDKPRRGTRVREPTKQMNLVLNNFKDFLNLKFESALPQDYSTLTNEQKQEVWKNEFDKLKNQKLKLHYLLPDSRPQDDINFVIQTLKKYNLDNDNVLDYEYESIFFGNKKQLLIYIKCNQMNSYLQKYKLPKSYQTTIKGVQKICLQISDLKIRRNIHISKLQKQASLELTKKINELQTKFNKQYEKFQALMTDLFQDFQAKQKRTLMSLTAIRFVIFQKLKVLGNKYDLYVLQKFPQVENDQFLDVQITKKSEIDKFLDKQQTQENKEQQNYEQDDDKSSVVSELSQDEYNQLSQLSKLRSKKSQAIKPPVGVYTIKYEKYEDKTLFLKVGFQYTKNKTQYPASLQYSWMNRQNFKKLTDIQDPSKDIVVQIPFQKGNYVMYYFRTRNDYGCSAIKSYQYLLNLDQHNKVIKNGKFLFFGESKVLIPQQKSKKVGEFYQVSLGTADFSMSQMQTAICDDFGNSADWGLAFRKDNDENNEYLQKNEYFVIPNVAKNRVYQGPGLRLDSSQSIIKVSCGRGYGMQLSSYGTVWVYGKNLCGQLGIKEQPQDYDDTVKLRFFQQNKIFVTDIMASECSASFAIDSNGTMYKWGADQFLSTDNPIFDRFGMIINYSTNNQITQQWTPLIVKKHFDNQRIVKIACGHQFYYMLNNQGTLYGWGLCRNLGKGILKDGNDEEIENICKEIEIMENVYKVSAGRDHTLAITTEGKVYGWGNLQFLSDIAKEFSYDPVDLSQQYGILSPQDKIQCGPSYTCVYLKSEKKIKLIGQTGKFSKKQIIVQQPIRKICCQQGVIGILAQNSKQNLQVA